MQVDFAKPVTFDLVLLMECLNNGQHVQSFRIEVWDGSRWQAVIEGHTIGHKRIEGFAPRTASRVRLNILNSTIDVAVVFVCLAGYGLVTGFVLWSVYRLAIFGMSQ